MNDNNYTNGRDKDFSKGPSVVMNRKEQIIKFSRSFDKYLDVIWNQDIERFWESFLVGGNNK